LSDAEKEKLEEVLSEAGDNWRELARALEAVEPAYRPGMRYVVTHMPNGDLLSMRSDLLIEYVSTAYVAREKVCWGEDIPEELFLKYVLPHRAGSEPLEPWRRDFFERLYPLVAACPTSGEATLKVNEWAASKVKYQPSSLMQGPYEMLKSGYGRCGEEASFLVLLCRSVAIPARKSYTPWWPMQDDNHAWLEVWDTGEKRWRFVGACEPTPLDHGWFESHVKKAAKIYSVEFGRPDTEIRNRLEERKDLKDVTERYVEAMGTVQVRVTEEGTPVKGTRVGLSVWNYSSLRPIASGITDAMGTVEVSVGVGTYFATAGRPERNTWGLVTVTAGEVEKVRLDLMDRRNEDVIGMR